MRTTRSGPWRFTERCVASPTGAGTLTQVGNSLNNYLAGGNLVKKILIILATGGLICAAGTGVALADSHEGGALEPASPIEIYACNFNEGKGPADLDKAVAASSRRPSWVRQWPICINVSAATA